MALLHSAHYQQSLRRYQTQRVRCQDLNKGDLMLRLRQDSRGRHKLTLPWEGPYIIAEVLKPGTYKLANEKGEVFTNAWNIQQLRRFYPLNSELFVHTLYSYLKFPEIIKKYALLTKFSGDIRTLGGSNARTTLREPWLCPEPPSGATAGGTPKCPQSVTFFLKTISHLSLSNT